MRVFQVKISGPESYSWTENHGTYHDEYKARRESYPERLEQHKLRLQVFGIEQPEQEYVPILVNETQLLDLISNKISHEMVCEVPVPKGDPMACVANFETVANRLMSMPALQAANYDHAMFNERVNIHMPGNALSAYNEVLLLETGCSDALQRYLDQGYRIIAACPQPDSRRPDYVLGRYNPDRIPDGSEARRG